MLTRIRNAYRILTTKAPETSPTEPLSASIDRYRNAVAVASSHPDERPPVGPNPAIRVLEVLSTLVLVAYVIGPLTRAILGNVERPSYAILTTTASLAVYFAMEEVKVKLSLTGKLNFLDPYFGHRLRKAKEILAR